MEQHVNFEFSAPYYTLNELTDLTTDVWIVCPGYGQLSKHFIRRFDVFDSETHFVVALQGLSKFYLSGHQKVGASWMTKEDRSTDLNNQKSYFEATMEHALKGKDIKQYKLHLLGFSQGVSMISRMAVFAKSPFATLILWAGGFPTELTDADFSFVDSESNLRVVLGDQDEFYSLSKNYQKEIDRMREVIGIEPKVIK